MHFHLEMEAEELTRFGTGRSEALRLARRRFGGVARYEDEARDARGGRWLEQLRQDTRYALRLLGRGRCSSAGASSAFASPSAPRASV